MVTVQEAEAWALALPDAVPLPHFEKKSYRIKKKIFATLDVMKQRLVVKLSEVDQSVFCSHNPEVIYAVPGAWGKHGYTMIELKKVRKGLCREALRVSYETVLKGKKKS